MRADKALAVLVCIIIVTIPNFASPFLNLGEGNADVSRPRNLQTPEQEPNNADFSRIRNIQSQPLEPNNADISRTRNLQSPALEPNDADVSRVRNLQAFELAPPPMYRLTVKVMNSSSLPVSNAVVKTANVTNSTNLSGEVFFDLPFGTYNVTASHPDYQSASWIVDLDNDRNITLTLACPYVFVGEIPDAHIVIGPAQAGYNITLLNNLALSTIDVFIEWKYMGTIPATNWRSFEFNHLPNLVVIAASKGSSDYPKAWYKHLLPIELIPTTGKEGAFLPEHVPYAAGSIFVIPYPPLYGQNTTIGVSLHNPYNHTLHISRIDFLLSGLTIGGYFSSIGYLSDIILQENETNSFSIIWLANVTGHHCVRVVLTYSPYTQSMGKNLDIEDKVISGDTGEVSFTLVNPYQTTKKMTIKMDKQIPLGWQVKLEINGRDYDPSSEPPIDLAPGCKLSCSLRIKTTSSSESQMGVINVEGYIDGKMVGGLTKEVIAKPTSTSDSLIPKFWQQIEGDPNVRPVESTAELVIGRPTTLLIEFSNPETSCRYIYISKANLDNLKILDPNGLIDKAEGKGIKVYVKKYSDTRFGDAARRIKELIGIFEAATSVAVGEIPYEFIFGHIYGTFTPVIVQDPVEIVARISDKLVDGYNQLTATAFTYAISTEYGSMEGIILPPSSSVVFSIDIVPSSSDIVTAIALDFKFQYVETPKTGHLQYMVYDVWAPRPGYPRTQLPAKGEFVQPSLAHASLVVKVGQTYLGRKPVLGIFGFSPIDILVTDPFGRQVGFNQDTSSNIIEIPEAIYTGSFFEPQILTIPNAQAGTYRIKIFGRQNGTYGLKAETIMPPGDLISMFSWNASIESEGSHEYYLYLAPNGIIFAKEIKSCDFTGVRKDTFNLNENVYINGRGFSPSITYDIYIVNDTTWSDGMPIPSRVLGTATTITADDSGNISPTTVWNASLLIGKYDIIIDVNGNGRYDEGIDVLDDNDVEVTAGFVAIPEFPCFAIMLLAFLCMSLSAILTRKKWSTHSDHSTKNC